MMSPAPAAALKLYWTAGALIGGSLFLMLAIDPKVDWVALLLFLMTLGGALAGAWGGLIHDRSDMPLPHVCDEEKCVCPVHGTWLLYNRHYNEHACQNSACRYAHGLERQLVEEMRIARYNPATDRTGGFLAAHQLHHLGGR